MDFMTDMTVRNMPQYLAIAEKQKQNNLAQQERIAKDEKIAHMDEMGRKFMAFGDYSPEGIRKFTTENNVTGKELEVLMGVVSTFKKQEMAQSKYDRGILESDRTFNREVLESNRDYRTRADEFEVESGFAKEKIGLQQKKLAQDETQFGETIKQRKAEETGRAERNEANIVAKAAENLLGRKASEKELAIATAGKVALAKMKVKAAGAFDPTKAREDGIDLIKTFLGTSADLGLDDKKQPLFSKLLTEVADAANLKGQTAKGYNDALAGIMSTAVSYKLGTSILDRIPTQGSGMFSGDQTENAKTLVDEAFKVGMPLEEITASLDRNKFSGSQKAELLKGLEAPSGQGKPVTPVAPPNQVAPVATRGQDQVALEDETKVAMVADIKSDLDSGTLPEDLYEKLVKSGMDKAEAEALIDAAMPKATAPTESNSAVSPTNPLGL